MGRKKVTLDADETRIFRVRKHWFVFGLSIFGICIVAIIPLVAFILGVAIAIEYVPMISMYTGHFIAIYTAWLILAWIALFSIWTNYYLDVWTLTTKRLIAVDQRGFFHRTTASFPLERLQDVTVSIDGMVPTFLDYGTLMIQTAGEEQKFVVRGLPRPETLKAQILEASANISASH